MGGLGVKAQYFPLTLLVVLTTLTLPCERDNMKNWDYANMHVLRFTQVTQHVFIGIFITYA